MTLVRLSSCHATRLNRSARIGSQRFGKYTDLTRPSPSSSEKACRKTVLIFRS
ncbi:hypothetical protein D3C86_2128540 [compost metagenome]